MADDKINVGGRLHSIATGNILANADEIYDVSKSSKQSVINAETDAALEDRYTKDETYNKNELNSLITTPDVQHVTVTATEQTTAVTDILPSVGTANTIYRIGKWNGTQYNTSVYSEYAWNGSAYVLLDVKEYGIDDKPTPGSENLVTSGGVAEEFSKREGTGSNDFSVADEKNNDIVQFFDGHIKTKNFNSKTAKEKLDTIEEGAEVNNTETKNEDDADLSFCDENDKSIVQFKKGHIKTKNFDSSEQPSTESLNNADFAISDEKGNKIFECVNGHIKTKNFDSQKGVVNLPEYYDDYLVEVSDKINALILANSKESDGFFFITDTHVSSNTLNGGKIIKNLQELTPIKKVVWGGDGIAAFGTKSDLDEQIFVQDKYLKECCGLGILFNVRGNHDYLIMNSASDQTNGYIYSEAATRNILSNERNKVVYAEDTPDTYYYFDNEVANIRYIVLSTSESLGEGTTVHGVDGYARDGIARPGTSGCTERMEKQWNWLFDVALNTDINIVIISHIPFSLICSSSGNGSYELRQTLRAYQNRRSIFGYDFSDAKGHILACIGGHSHVDSQEMNDGILFVTTSCDAYPNDNGSTKNVAIDVVTDERGIGTVKEQIIDYYNFDAINQVVKTVRIGGGKDRFFHINVIELSVGDTYTLTPEYITASSWVSYNEGNHDEPDDVWPTWNSERNLVIPNDRVSVSNGVVTALKAGGANVVAISNNSVIELFYIKIIN